MKLMKSKEKEKIMNYMKILKMTRKVMKMSKVMTMLMAQMKGKQMIHSHFSPFKILKRIRMQDSVLISIKDL